MSEEEANIDLGYYRRQVADFGQEYKDISCWYKLNQKGESVVRTQAENVVKAVYEAADSGTVRRVEICRARV